MTRSVETVRRESAYRGFMQTIQTAAVVHDCRISMDCASTASGHSLSSCRGGSRRLRATAGRTAWSSRSATAGSRVRTLEGDAREVWSHAAEADAAGRAGLAARGLRRAGDRRLPPERAAGSVALRLGGAIDLIEVIIASHAIAISRQAAAHIAHIAMSLCISHSAAHARHMVMHACSIAIMLSMS